MKKMPVLACLLTCVLLNACVSATRPAQRPAWIDSAQSVYPESDYLTAVGQASKRDRASKNAKANLAEIAYVHVQAQTSTLTEATKAQSALGVTSESSTLLQRSIQTETDQAMSGVTTKDSWLDDNGEYYVLAVLAKRSAALSLNESIIALDESTAELIDYSINTAPNAILSLNALRAARDEQLARQMANLQLKQVSHSGVPADISSKKIERLIAQKLASMQVSVNIEAPKHAKTVESGLGNLGMHVVDNANIVVTADYDISAPMLLNGWYWIRGSYELSFSENNHVISRKRWPIKVSAKQEALLTSRLKDGISEKISAYLIELVSDSPTL